MPRERRSGSTSAEPRTGEHLETRFGGEDTSESEWPVRLSRKTLHLKREIFLDCRDISMVD